MHCSNVRFGSTVACIARMLESDLFHAYRNDRERLHRPTPRGGSVGLGEGGDRRDVVLECCARMLARFRPSRCSSNFRFGYKFERLIRFKFERSIQIYRIDRSLDPALARMLRLASINSSNVRVGSVIDRMLDLAHS